MLAWQELLTRYVAPRLGLVRTHDPDSTGAGEDLGLVPSNIAALKEMIVLARSGGAFPIVECCDLAIAVADGLSSAAVHAHAAPLIAVPPLRHW